MALDPGVSRTGWAVFRPGCEDLDTGVIGMGAGRTVSAQARLSHLVERLDSLVERWSPGSVAQSQPSGFRWRVPALALLDAALDEWSDRHHLTLHAYSAQELRSVIAGHSNASKKELAYAVMEGLGMIGTVKSSSEWEAVAVGRYHLARLGSR